MVRHTDAEMIVMKGEIIHSSLGTGSMENPTGPHREVPGSIGGRESKGKAWARAFILVSTGRNRQGR